MTVPALTLSDKTSRVIEAKVNTTLQAQRLPTVAFGARPILCWAVGSLGFLCKVIANATEKASGSAQSSWGMGTRAVVGWMGKPCGDHQAEAQASAIGKTSRQASVEVRASWHHLAVELTL